MPEIYELFGFQLRSQAPEAVEMRRKAWCPFMDRPCDGGGNRHLSHINLTKTPELQSLYPGRESIPSGVCSIALAADATPWIVCPRRIVALGHAEHGVAEHQSAVTNAILLRADRDATRYAVWNELKLKCKQGLKVFDYTFDCVVMPIAFASAERLTQLLNISWPRAQRQLIGNGHELVVRNGVTGIDTFPMGKPLIVEIMTSSTSGGNKKKRSTIPNAVEDALLGRTHRAPGINYRQVWARMVSQLIVKSEVSLAWGGRTFWVLQDKLVKYISNSTALDLAAFLANVPSEVNILSLSYPTVSNMDSVIALDEIKMYAGPIAQGESRRGGSFQDMVKAPFVPPISALQKALLARKPNAYLVRE